MTEFWLSAGLLLLAALAFLLLPILRSRRQLPVEQDRTALNVALYEERVAELGAQQRAGLLDAGQLQRGTEEAARELLSDTEPGETPRQGHLGKAVPVLVALMVPLLAVGLYLHVGAADKVELTREFASAPTSMQDMTTRLERTVQAQPESAEGWYFLGRAYMAEQRAGDAANAFERAVALAGRQPELLGQWAQAQYFAADKQWSASLQALTDEALKADPNEVTSLGLRGIAAFEGERFQEAIDYWQRLLAQLPEGDTSRAALQGGIERAAQRIAADGGKAVKTASLKVRVELAPELRDQVRPDDKVFIFARAVNGPPMPLAAKRVTVAQLPIEVALSDADAMLPQMKLSDVDSVQLVARVSRSGQPGKGEWIGQGPVLTGHDQPLQRLTIDRPDR